MNAERRKTVQKALTLIDEARAILEGIQSEEQDYYDNMPESLQSGEKGEKAQETADALQSAIDEIDNAYSDIENAINP